MATGTVRSNGVELFYETRGPEDGEPLVFIMGLSAQLVFWPEGLLDAMANRGYRVIAFDNRDAGKSTAIREPLKYGPMMAMLRYMVGLKVHAPYTLDDLVADTMGLLDALGIERAHLVGASMGGMVALDWAQNAPAGQIQALVLINTSCGFSPPWHRMRPGAWPRIMRLLARRELFEREADILRLTCNTEPELATMKRWYSIQRQRRVSPRTAWQQLQAAVGYRPRAKRPLPDGLLLASQRDRIVHWRCSEALEQRWHWTMKLHPWAGHDLPLDDPEWIVAQIRQWRNP